MDMDQVIKEINELAKIAKERELTQEEQNKRMALREVYLSIFRKNFQSQLDNIDMVDESGKVIGPLNDLKKAKKTN